MSRKTCYDGHLVTGVDPVQLLMPYVLQRKTDSELKLEVKMNLDKVEAFIKSHKEDMPGLTLYHVVFASIVRACATTPQINRFIAGGRLYQRDHVRISMMIKKRLEIDGKETSIFPTFEKWHTLQDIVDITNKKAEEALASLDADSNDFDRLATVLTSVPAFVIKRMVGFLIWLDKFGKLPQSLVDTQPFHSTFFITNVGSIGLPAIYHHLYEFGTISGFLGVGAKEIERTINAKGEVVSKKVLPLNFVLDGRICDGFTYSKALRTIKKCFEHPEWLLESYAVTE